MLRSLVSSSSVQPQTYYNMLKTDKLHTIHEGSKSFTFILHTNTLRYTHRGVFHPYGRKCSFDLTFTTPTGTRLRKYFSDIGATDRAAFSNALRVLRCFAQD
jgi:glucuronate isomerase